MPGRSREMARRVRRCTRLYIDTRGTMRQVGQQPSLADCRHLEPVHPGAVEPREVRNLPTTRPDATF
jgi:hypothetical protein